MSSIYKKFSLLILITIVGFVVSFGNQILVSYHFGTNKTLDGYWSALALANFMMFYVHPLRDSIVPRLHITSSKSKKNSSEVYTAAIVLQLFLGVSSALIFFVVSKYVFNVLDSSDANNLYIVIAFCLYIITFGLAEISSGALVSADRVVSQATIRLASGLAALFVFISFVNISGIGAVILSLLTAQVVVLVVSHKKLGECGVELRWRGFQFLRTNSEFKHVFLSLIFIYALSQFYVLAERVAMSKMAEGLVSSYQYSVALVNVLISILGIPLSNILMPRFLNEYSIGGIDAALQLVVKIAPYLMFVLIGVCIYTSKFSYEIVKLLYARGSFGEDSVLQTSRALSLTVFAIIPISFLTILGKVLVVDGKGVPMAIIGVATSLAGVAIVSLSYHSDSLQLIRSHWVISNSIGFLIALVVFVRQNEKLKRLVLPAILWTSGATFIFIISLVLSPNITASATVLESIIKIIISFSLYALISVILAYITGLLQLKNLNFR